MNELYDLSVQVGERLLAQQQWLATCESCTGGWLAQAITAVAGSSQWFDRGFVTYTNAAKVEMLGVDAKLLDQYGAVSEQVAAAMALGGLKHSHANHAVAITGIAGPGGATADKPVGMVWFAYASNNAAVATQVLYFSGDRESVRKQAVLAALQTLLGRLT